MKSLPVEKSSGIIDEEVESNRSYTTINAKTILDSRNNELKKINKRLDVIIKEVKE